MSLIDRSAVHRSTQADVLVRAVERAGEREWRADIALPRAHWLCHPRPRRVPLTLVAEAFRQAGMAICIAGLGIEASAHFVISAMTVEADAQRLVFPRFGAFEAPLEVVFAEVRYRKGLPHQLEVDYSIPGLASGRVSAQVLTDRDYRAVRRNASVFTGEVGDAVPELIHDVSRSAGRLTARLGVDYEDPFFFDHAVDHLPGMLLLHAAGALHESEHGAPATGFSISFPAFGELGADTEIDARYDAEGTGIAFQQRGKLIASARMMAAAYAAGTAA